MIDGADRNIEPVRQSDLAAGEIYNVKQISRDSRQANDRQFEKQLKKEQKKDDQDKADKKASRENYHADDPLDGPDYPAGIRDDIILSSEAREMLSRNNPPEKNSTPEDNDSQDNNSGENNGKPGINLKA